MRVLHRAASWIRNALAVLGLLLAVVSFTPAVSWWARALANPWNGCEGDVLIVLAGSHQEDAIGESSYLRALYAVRADRECHYRKILISGRQASEAMREFLIGQSVPADRIVIENESASTYDNARLLAPALRNETGSRLVLLTSDYHVWRSVRVFAKAGFTVQSYPAPDALKRAASWEKRWAAFQDLCLESVKIGYYRWRGWI
jgi:uncharacterized SAM-binding protein YcdF (DUF218 family)